MINIFLACKLMPFSWMRIARRSMPPGRDVAAEQGEELAILVGKELFDVVAFFA
jgi:hypothetical protein